MATSHSTARLKPAKPYPDFPLSWRSAGHWCKRIRGKLHYFGPPLGRLETGATSNSATISLTAGSRDPPPMRRKQFAT